jgi:putative ABC transport system permease protein
MTARKSWWRYRRFWGQNFVEDVEEEIDFHFDMRVNEYIARGLSPEDARQRAAQRFGDVRRAREECVVINEQFARSEGRAQWLGAVRQDTVFAARLLRRQWFPSLIAVLCLALGIGAATTMFSVGNTLLLRPLPFPNAERVVSITTTRMTNREVSTIVSYPDFVDWQRRARSFDDMTVSRQGSFTFVLSTPIRASGASVTARYFHVLGVQPEAGRLFTLDDDRPGAPQVLIVSHSFAESRLGGAKDVVGKEFIVGGVKRTVVGVIPDQMRLPSSGQVWAPMQRNYATANRGNRDVNAMAVLKRGVTAEQALRELEGISVAIGKEHPDRDVYAVSSLPALRERFVGSSRSGLAALSAATLLVLLVACTNVAALQVARSAARAKEIAVRVAIGAGRQRVVRQLLTESVAFSVTGGLLGIGIAMLGMKYVARSIAASAPPWMHFGLDARALAFTVAISVAVGVIFGVSPALRLARIDPNEVLRGGQAPLGLARGALQRLFVSSEIALSVILVVGALLAIQSVTRLQRIPLGVDPTGVLTFRMTLQGPRYEKEPPRVLVVSELEQAIERIPGIEAAGATTHVPLIGCCSKFGVQIEGRQTDAANVMMVTGSLVTPGFFKSVRIPLLQGRTFTRGDDASAPKVVVINETFAKRFWPNGDAVGHRIDSGNGVETIIGVVGDIKQARIDEAPEPQFYRAHMQDPWDDMTFTVRVTNGDAQRVISDVRRALRDLDATLPVYGAQTMDQMLASFIDSHRVFSILFGAFAAVALTLATAGVYAIMSFFVSQRTRELGLRVALGAESQRVVGYVMRQGAVLAATGGIVGLGAGMLAARYLAHTLYGVSASEPLLYVVAAGTLVVAAGVASYGPARRASTVDPMVALRPE